MTFAEAVGEVAEATGNELVFVNVEHDEFLASLRQAGVPEEYVGLLDYLFSEVLDGRNASLASGVQSALGRGPRDFRAYVERTVDTGAWSIEMAR